MAAEVNTRSQIYWNTLLRIPVQIIVFIFSIMVTRILDPKDFGVMAIVMMLIGYSNLLTSFGFNEAIIQRGIKDKKTLDSIFAFDVGVSVVLALLFYFGAGLIADFFDAPEVKDVVQVMCAVFVISSFYAFPYTLLRRDMKFKSVSLFDAGKSLMASVLTLILALNHFGYWALVYGQIIPLLLFAILICAQMKWFPSVFFSIGKMKGVFHFGAWNFFKSQLHFFAAHIDRFIVGKWLDVVSLGYYDKAVTLSRTPYDSFTMNINSVMFSSFSQRNGDLEALRSQFAKSMALVAYINFPVYLGLIVVAPYFVSVLLGEKWEPMTSVFQIILAGYLASSFAGMLSSLIVGVGKYKQLTLLLFVSVLFFVSCCFVLIKYEIVGIAVSYLLFSALLVFLWTMLAVKSIDMRLIDAASAIIGGAVSSGIMFFVVMGLSVTLLNERSVMNMLALIAIGGLTYIVCLYFDRSMIATGLKSNIIADSKKLFLKIRRAS